MKRLRLTRSIALTLVSFALALAGSNSVTAAEPRSADKTPAELQAGAKAGDAEALFLLGRAYWEGKGVKIDQKKAVELYGKAGEKNHALALAHLGAAYANGLGVEKQDDRQAAEYYRKAAELGSAMGQMNLGGALLSGWGVEKNPEEGVRWLTKAAEQGASPAQSLLAQLYFTGDSNVPRDFSKAALWARKAADQDEPAALNLYGVMLRDGVGVKRNAPASVPYFQRAVEKNCLLGYLNMGFAYFGGNGVKPDRVTGLGWWYAGEILGNKMCGETVKRYAGDGDEESQKAMALARKMVGDRNAASLEN